jgi:hypothetical protein
MAAEDSVCGDFTCRREAPEASMTCAWCDESIVGESAKHFSCGLLADAEVSCNE